MKQPNSIKVLQAFKDNPRARNMEVQAMTGLSERQVAGAFTNIQRRGYVIVYGGGYSGRDVRITETGERRLAGQYFKASGRMDDKSTVSRPKMREGEPIRRPCLMCRKPFDSKDKRKEWICKVCKSNSEYRSAVA